MKNLNDFVLEKLKLNKKSVQSEYEYVPKNLIELQRIISDLSKKSDYLDASIIDISNLHELDNAFACAGSSIIDVSGWDTKRVVSASYAFSNCFYLKKIIGIENWDTSNMKDIQRMFSHDKSLEELDLSKWNVSNIEKINGLFVECSNLKTVGDLSDWKFTNSLKLYNMFAGCSKIKDLGDLSNWNIKTTSMFNMFSGCESLEHIGDISNWDVIDCRVAGQLFYKCKKLNDVGDLTKWTFKKLFVNDNDKTRFMDIFYESPLDEKFKIWGQRIIKKR